MDSRRLTLRQLFRLSHFALTFLLFSHAESSAGSLRLTWNDNSTNESGFKIERKAGSGGTFSVIASVAANSTSYNDTGLVNGTTYCYRISAFNATQNSTYSNESCGVPKSSAANTITTNISDGAVLSGASVIWTATPTGVPARVEFWIDGILKWTDLQSVYQFNGDPSGTLNTTTLSNGSHQLKVRAVYSDNSTAEKTVSVTVSNGTTTQQFTLTVTKSGTGTGTVTSSPAGINCGSDCS